MCCLGYSSVLNPPFLAYKFNLPANTFNFILNSKANRYKVAVYYLCVCERERNKKIIKNIPRKMKPNSCSIFIKLLVLQYLSVLCVSQDFDFFYFVQQWPGAYCDTKQHSCCYPKSGKPAADFGIHGLWPNYKDGGYPSNCDPDSRFDKSEISDLIGTLEKEWPTLSCPSNDGTKFWTHEWVKHGTCSESELDQHEYFQAALKLKQKANLLQALTNAGIKPNDEFYELQDIEDAIKEAVGFTPGIECNTDSSRNSQLYQIYLCVDTSGSDFIKCPLLPRSRCGSRIQFPKF